MQTVLDYCLEVQQQVANMRPGRDDPNWMDWFAASGRASTAVTFALMGEDHRALRITDLLAEKYLTT